MFDKDEKAVAAGPGTVIGGNVTLVGALRDNSDVTIHGSVEGEVASERNVTIGETAQIKGPVNGATVTVAGLVRGSVEAQIRVEILATGKILGDIVTKDLIIRSGATFIGKCTMPDQPDQAAKHQQHQAETKRAATEPTPNKAQYDVE